MKRCYMKFRVKNHFVVLILHKISLEAMDKNTISGMHTYDVCTKYIHADAFR